jgi:ribosomal protein S21
VAIVVVGRDETIEQALARFKTKLRKEGFFEEIHRKRYYIKKSMIIHMRKKAR